MRETKISTHLSGGRLNVALVQETMRTELLNLLQLYIGPKVSIKYTYFDLFSLSKYVIYIMANTCQKFNG